MLLSEIYIKIAEFVELAINDVSLTVTFANQNAPVPTKPFITCSINNLNAVGFPMKYEMDDNGLQRLVINKSFTITLNSYSDQLHQAEDMLNLVQNKLRTDFSYYHFQADMVYIRTLTGVSAIPTEINGINESRAMLEMEFALTQTIYDDVGLIDHIAIEDETTGNDIIINR
jgi:hypothetical protein